VTRPVANRTLRLLALLVPAAVTLAAARPALAEKQIVFPQGSEQPLSALQDIDVIEHLGERVPSGLEFADAEGRKVKLESLLGRDKPILVTLGYHRCPMLCGLILDGLVKAGGSSGLALGKDFLAVDLSIDPAEDAKLMTATQRRVLELVGKGATAADWPFWRSAGDGGAAVRALADAVGFRYKYDEDSKQFAHEAVAFVLTPSRDKVVMSCYRYDPAKRRYAPFVMGFMRIGAGLVFFALAGLLTVLWRKEISMRKRRAA
jgi:protein SCO1/2